MTKFRHTLILAAAVGLLCLPAAAAADTTVRAKLVEVNDTGASGSVTLTVTDDGALKVVIRSQGLLPNVPHAQHIHGSAHGGHFMCPSLEDADADGDKVLTNEEGMGEYGTIYFPLTTKGGATPADALAADRMPVADSQGRVSYERTFPAGMIPDGLIDNLSSLHVVQHGIDVNGNGKYDLAALGESTFAKNQGKAGIPEEATNPAVCGVVQGAGAAAPARGGAEAGGLPVAGVNQPLLVAGVAALVLAVGVAISAVALSRASRSGR